jgi:hypothetical protein
MNARHAPVQARLERANRKYSGRFQRNCFQLVVLLLLVAHHLPGQQMKPAVISITLSRMICIWAMSKSLSTIFWPIRKGETAAIRIDSYDVPTAHCV